LSGMEIVLVNKSTPSVASYSIENLSSTARRITDVLPDDSSPKSTTLNFGTSPSTGGLFTTDRELGVDASVREAMAMSVLSFYSDNIAVGQLSEGSTMIGNEEIVVLMLSSKQKGH